MEELSTTGLKLNPRKSKILTTCANLCPAKCTKVLFVDGVCVHILKAHEHHRYPGKYISCSKERSDIELAHRARAA
eukprot:6983082-Karenia_brevis.AAC.1